MATYGHSLTSCPVQDSGDFAGYEEKLKGANEGFAGLTLPAGLPNPFAAGEEAAANGKKASLCRAPLVWHLCSVQEVALGLLAAVTPAIQDTQWPAASVVLASDAPDACDAAGIL